MKRRAARRLRGRGDCEIVAPEKGVDVSGQAVARLDGVIVQVDSNVGLAGKLVGRRV